MSARERPTKAAIRGRAIDLVVQRLDDAYGRAGRADTDPKFIECVAAEEARLTAAMTEEQTFEVKLTRDELVILGYVLAVADDGERVLKDTYELYDLEPVDCYFTAQSLQRKFGVLKWEK